MLSRLYYSHIQFTQLNLNNYAKIMVAMFVIGIIVANVPEGLLATVTVSTI